MICLWYTHVPNFGSTFILKVQKTFMSFESLFEALEVPNWGFVFHLDFYLATGLWYNYVQKIFSSLFLRCKIIHVLLSTDMGFWRTLEVLDWGLGCWSWLRFNHWYLIHPCSKFWLSLEILKVQRTSMSFKSWFRAFEDAGGSWLGFGILILIWIWSRSLFESFLKFSVCSDK